MATEQAAPMADKKATLPAESGQTKDPESKKMRWCGRYCRDFRPVERFSKEGVRGCDMCRELDAEYSQNARARKRKAKPEKEKERKKRFSERTRTETGQSIQVGGDVSTVESGDQNHVERGTCSNSHR
jgi:hypothetical protein